MKKIFFSARTYLLLIFASVSIFAQDFQTVHDGVEYARVMRQSKSADGKDENIVINLLRLDLKKVRLDVVHAMDSAIGLEKTSSIAMRYGAFAAINAGFFRIDKSIFEGDDVSALKINGKILSDSNSNRVALFIKNDSKQTSISINHLNLFGTISVGKDHFDSIGINRQRKEDDLVVFTPEFHRTTLTGAEGLEIAVRSGKITGVFEGKGSTVIPEDGFVISASGKRREEMLPKIKAGMNASFQFIQADFGQGLTDNHEGSAPVVSEDIVSGVPMLVLNGKANVTWQEEKSSKSFVETHHPRTAVALLKDGKFLMVTVDGRSEESGGISLYQLADFLLEQGATAAMNLDGGGSSTMFLDGKVINHPSDKEGERKIGDAILVFPR